MTALIPPLLLLLWSGVAATALTGFLLAPLLSQRFGGIALASRAGTPARAWAHGVLLLPLLYAPGFAALGRATILTGALLGILHAALLALLALRSGGTALLRASTPRLLLAISYGALLGFAFVTP